MTTQELPRDDVTPEVIDPQAMLRELTDPKTLRALTHPVRLALLEELALEGPLTATQAGELIERQIVASMQKMRRCLAYDSSEL